MGYRLMKTHKESSELVEEVEFVVQGKGDGPGKQ